MEIARYYRDTNELHTEKENQNGKRYEIGDIMQKVFSIEKKIQRVKTEWHRKSLNSSDLIAFTDLEDLSLKDDTVTVKIILENEEFLDLLNDFLKPREWIEILSGETLEVTCRGLPGKILIDPKGYRYARYTSLCFE